MTEIAMPGDGIRFWEMADNGARLTTQAEGFVVEVYTDLLATGDCWLYVANALNGATRWVDSDDVVEVRRPYAGGPTPDLGQAVNEQLDRLSDAIRELKR
jgi:hypothetical protein